MFKFALPSLILLFLPLLGCTSGISTEEYNALKGRSEKAESSLAQAQAELAKTKTALSNATDKIAGLQASLDEAQAPLVKERAAYLELLLSNRRSIREYADSPLTKDVVMKLLWAGQGITGAMGARTAPSAGAFYPLSLYLVAGKVTDLSSGLYKYLPAENSLTQIKDKDLRSGLAEAAYNQQFIQTASIDIVVAAIYEKTAEKYGTRAERFVHMEAGHAAQNIVLEATALDLGSVTVGGFDDGKVAITLGLPRNENPLYIIPVGRKK